MTLTVPAHRAVAIVGDAATGIHHLAPIVLGLEAAVSGRALLLGEEVAAMPRRAALAFRRKVGYVPEGDGLLHNLSLADNVGLPLRFGTALESREVEGRLRVVLAAFRLTDVAHVRPADVDDEQRRRPAFARAVVFDPPLVLLAQPFDRIVTATAVELLVVSQIEDFLQAVHFVPHEVLPHPHDVLTVTEGACQPVAIGLPPTLPVGLELCSPPG